MTQGIAHVQDQLISGSYGELITDPLVSVVIVSHNSRIYLRNCLDSIQLGSRLPSEVILVDNASEDGSADLIANEYPAIQLVRGLENLGYPKGNNVGARIAQGIYLLFLNPDTVLAPGAIDRLIDALEANPRAGLATAKILLADSPNQINTCGNNVHLSGITLCRGAGLPIQALEDSATVSAVSGAAFLIRRELFQALGGFDDDFFLYLEDTDISLRARLAGTTCVYVPEALVYHNYRLRFTQYKTYFLERNRYLMLLKAFRWKTLALLVPVLLLAEVISWSFSLLEEKSVRNKLRVYGWMIHNWRKVPQKRREVQATRQITDRELLSQHNHWLDFSQTGGGWAQKTAALIFNPFFWLYGWLLKGLIWW